MEKVFIKQNHGKGSVLIFFLVLLLISCNGNRNHATEVQLHEFVVDRELDIALDSVVSYLKEDYSSDLVLELMKSDSLLSIDVSLYDRNLISKYIYYNNRRIVGFLEKNKDTVLILSNIDNLYDLGESFSKFLYPTKQKGTFRYLQIPLSQYEMEEDNAPKKECASSGRTGNWGEIPYMYEPFVFSFKIKDARICYPPIYFRR